MQGWSQQSQAKPVWGLAEVLRYGVGVIHRKKHAVFHDKYHWLMQ